MKGMDIHEDSPASASQVWSACPESPFAKTPERVTVTFMGTTNPRDKGTNVHRHK